MRRIEVAEVTIRRLGVLSIDVPVYLIPDSRIKLHYARVLLCSHSEQAERVPWCMNENPELEFGWGKISLDNEISLGVADGLNQDIALTEGIMLSGGGFDIETDLIRGCWILIPDAQDEFTRLH